MRHQKGMAINFVILLALAAITLVVILLIARGPFQAGEKTFGEEIRRSEARLCELKGVQDPRIPDCDKDKYPDPCDFCLGGNDGKDSDGDALPDDCDNDIRNPAVPGTSLSKICKDKSGVWDKAAGRCYLKTVVEARDSAAADCRVLAPS